MPTNGDRNSHDGKRAWSNAFEHEDVGQGSAKRPRKATARKTTGGKPPRDWPSSKATPIPNGTAHESEPEQEEGISSVRGPVVSKQVSSPSGEGHEERDGVVGRRRRYRPSVAALKKVREPKARFDILRGSFVRSVREVALDMVTDEVQYGSTGLRWRDSALEALQEASEAYLVTIFSNGFLAMLHAKRKTLMVEDIQLARLGGRP